MTGKVKGKINCIIMGLVNVSLTSFRRLSATPGGYTYNMLLALECSIQKIIDWCLKGRLTVGTLHIEWFNLGIS